MPPPPASPPSWLRRLTGYCLRHRFDLFGSFGSALAGSLVLAARAADRQARRRHRQPAGQPGLPAPSVAPWVWLLVLAARAAVRADLRPPVLRRPAVAGRAVRPARRRLLLAAAAGRRGPGRPADRPGGQPVDQRRRPGAGPAVLPADPDRQRPAVPHLAGRHGGALTAAHPGGAGHPARARSSSPGCSSRDLFPANWSAQMQAGELVGQVEAAVTGVRVVKGFGQEHREVAELSSRARTLFAERMRVVRLQAKYSSSLTAVPALGQVGVLLVGGWLALHGRITLGTFLAFSTYVGQLVGAGPRRHRAADHRPAGPGRRRAGAGGDRLLARGARPARSAAAAGRPAGPGLRRRRVRLHPVRARCCAGWT